MSAFQTRRLDRIDVTVFLIALVVRLVSAWPLRIPGYFDAFYYYNVALDLVAGRGMTDFVVWNYLDGPFVLPRPSHLYWMPLTTWLAAIGIRVLGEWLSPWRAVQVLFAVMSALLPVLAARLARAWWERADFALAAGLFATFTGYYFVYWSVPDTFTPFALTVSLALLAAWRGIETNRAAWWTLAGVGVGLSHLTRADGVLVGLAFLPVIWLYRGCVTWWKAVLAVGVGYLATMVPWWWRNTVVVGSPLPGGGTRTIWLRRYDELFSFTLPLDPARYLAWGFWPIVRSKFRAIVWSSVVIVGGLQFFLAVPAAVGMWQRRYDPRVRFLASYTLILVSVMALVFTFPAQRGSVLHSAAALLPWLSALVPGGVAALVEWVARRRPSWNADQATRVFLFGFVGLVVLVSVWQYAMGVWLASGPSAVLPPWNRRFDHYVAVDRWLDDHGVSPDEPVLVVDPPSFYGMTGRRAVVIPTDGPRALEAVADLFGARFLVLEYDHAAAYNEAYDTGQLGGWRLRLRLEDALGHPVWLFERENTSER